MSDSTATQMFNELPAEELTPGVTSSLVKIFDNFDKRIHDLEQQLNGTYAGALSYTGAGNFPGGIVIGDVPIDLTPPPPVTGITVTPGTFYENIFCDVEWTEGVVPPGDPGDAVSFDVDLAEKLPGPIYNLLNFFNTSGSNYRLNNLEPNKAYGTRIVPVNNIGVRGATPTWTDFTTGADSTIPPAPVGLAIVRGATTVVVKFTGLTEIQAPDVAWGHGNYEIQIDTVNTFGSGNFRTTVSSATVVAFNDIIGELPQWYARVRAIDSSGNTSAWSSIAGPSGPMGGVGDSMIIADLSAAKIQFGTMSGDRIAVNTLDVGTLKTSSLTAADITLAGGSFRAGSPPTTGLLINSQGIRLYQGGSTTIILDAITGNASFSGSITASTIAGTNISGGTITGAVVQTSGSGQRIVMNASDDRLHFYSGDVSEVAEGKIFTDIDVAAGPFMAFESPAVHSGLNQRAYLYMYGENAASTLTTEIAMRARTLRLLPDDDFYNTLEVTPEVFSYRVNDGTDNNGAYIDAFYWSNSGTGVFYIGYDNAQMMFRVDDSGLRYGDDGGSLNFRLFGFGNEQRLYTDYGFYASNAGSDGTITPSTAYRDYNYAGYRAHSGGADANYVPALSAYNSGGGFAAGWGLSGGGDPLSWNALNSAGSGWIPIAASSFDVASSERFKKDIEPVSFTQSETERSIDMLEPKSFRYRGDDDEEEEDSDLQWGFIAEEVAEVFPEIVTMGENGPHSIRYMMLIPILVDHVKDLRSRITALESAN